jgi:Asp/Glu/Hydantoin racemase
MPPRIVLIHAVTVAMAPIEQAFASLWPETERVNLLDDSLSPDHARAGHLTPAMVERFEALAGYARRIGGRGILFTCSAFGEAIAAVARGSDIPVLKPNQAMFEDALAHGSRIGMLATFGPSVPSMEQEFAEGAAAIRPAATLETVLVDGALPALKAGDSKTHDRLLTEAAPRLAACDAVMLAHFSTSRAQASVHARLDCPVLSAPGSAVLRLKQALHAR